MTTTLPSNCAFPPSLPATSPSGKYNVVGFFFHEKSIISFSPSSWKVYTASSEFVTFQTLYAQPMTSPVINDNVYGIIQSGWPRTASSSGGETQPFVPWSIFHQFRKLTKSHVVDQDKDRIKIQLQLNKADKIPLYANTDTNTVKVDKIPPRWPRLRPNKDTITVKQNRQNPA